MKKSTMFLGICVFLVRVGVGAEVPEWVLDTPLAEDAVFGVGVSEGSNTDEARAEATRVAILDVLRQLSISGETPIARVRPLHYYFDDDGGIYVLMSARDPRYEYDADAAFAEFQEMMNQAETDTPVAESPDAPPTRDPGEKSNQETAGDEGAESVRPEWITDPPEADDAFYGVGHATAPLISDAMARARARALTEILGRMYDDGVWEELGYEMRVQKVATTDTGTWVLVKTPLMPFHTMTSEAFQRNEDEAFAEFKAQQALEEIQKALDDLDRSLLDKAVEEVLETTNDQEGGEEE